MPDENRAVPATTEELHAWDAGGAASAEALTAWVSGCLAAHQAARATLLAGLCGLAGWLAAGKFFAPL